MPEHQTYNPETLPNETILDPFEIGETATGGMVDIVSDGEPQKLTLLERANLDDYVRSSDQPEATKDLFADEALRFMPKEKLAIDGQNFYIGQVFESSNGRSVAVMYHKDDEGTITPRLAYRSQSGGDWRVATAVTPQGFSKGKGGDDGEYTQVTKLDDALSDALVAQEARRRPESIDHSELVRFFNPLKQEEINTFDREVNVKRMLTFSRDHEEALFNTYTPGKGLKGDAAMAREKLRSSDLTPEGFVPDFTQEPVHERSYDDPRAGRVTVKDYEHTSLLGDYVWHVAEDEAGHVWLEKMTSKEGTVTSYGTSSEVVLAGALSAKPFEYKSNVKGMEPDEDYDDRPGQYVDLRDKYWGNMAWVKQYKTTRGLAA